MDTKSIEKYLQEEIAAKVIMAMPEPQKNQVIADAIGKLLEKTIVSEWDIKQLLQEYAMAHAFEYAQTPDIQEKLKQQAHQVVDDVIDGIIKNIGKAIESDIKNKYSRILSEKLYGE